MMVAREALSSIFPPKHNFKQFVADSPLAKKSNNLTKFEKDVYRVVSKIPNGEVRPYKWVADRIGRPKAFRAVGNALNKNPYPKTIPCHRVIKQDGSIGGYSEGVALKRKLLSFEGIDYTGKRRYNRNKRGDRYDRGAERRIKASRRKV